MKDESGWQNILKLIEEDYEDNEYMFCKKIKYNYPLFQKKKQRQSLTPDLLKAMFRNQGISSDYVLHGIGPKTR